MVTVVLRLELTSSDEDELIGLKDAAVMALEEIGTIEITDVRVWRPEQIRMEGGAVGGFEAERARLLAEARQRARDQATEKRMREMPKGRR